MGTYLGEVKVVAGADKEEVFSGGATQDGITATTADNFVVASTVVGSAIRVLGVVVTSSLAARFRFGSAATTISPYINVSAAAPVILPIAPNRDAPWFKTTSGEALTVDIDGAGAMTGNSVVVKTVTSS